VVDWRSPQVTPLYRVRVPSGTTISPSVVRPAGALGARKKWSSRRIVMVPPRVRHVWVVEDPAASGRVLMGQLPKGARCVASHSDTDTAAYRIRIMDDALPGLVDSLAKTGGALVSPGPPQPSKSGFSRVVWGVRHRPVLYDVRFVTRR